MCAYLTALCVLVVARSLDLLTTWIICPDLSRELNPFARAMGWKWILVSNVIFCPIMALSDASWVVACVSVACALWNLIIYFRRQ